jgi:hypothetical protein
VRSHVNGMKACRKKSQSPCHISEFNPRPFGTEVGSKFLLLRENWKLYFQQRKYGARDSLVVKALGYKPEGRGSSKEDVK